MEDQCSQGNIVATYTLAENDTNGDGTRTYNEIEITAVQSLFPSTPLEFPFYPTIDANDRDYPINLPFEEDIPIIIWYFDADGDGYHSDTTEAETSPGTNWSNTTQGEDCDDSDASIRQGCDVCVREYTAQERAVETANKNAGKQEFILGIKVKDIELMNKLISQSIKTYNNEKPHLSCEMHTPTFMHKQSDVVIKTYKRKRLEDLGECTTFCVYR